MKPIQIRFWALPASIVLGAIVVAAGIVAERLIPDYTLASASDASVWRLNRLTGEINYCRLVAPYVAPLPADKADNIFGQMEQDFKRQQLLVTCTPK